MSHRPFAVLLFHSLLVISLAFFAESCDTNRDEGHTPGECSDGADNDGDSLFDCEDPDCASASDCLEGDDDDSGGSDDDDATAPCPEAMSAQGIDLVGFCAGSFEMGCTEGQTNCQPDESPAHSVSLSRDFWLGATEITQGQWQALLANNPSDNIDCGTNCPVEQVNWFEAAFLANELSAAEGLPQCYTFGDCTGTAGTGLECLSVTVTASSGSPYDCEGYRLPTEAEWEYAARAGGDLLYAGSNNIEDVGWYDANSNSASQPVAGRDPNAAGLWDMSGNVWEWTWDAYDANYYTEELHVDPLGPASTELRTYRGGAWYAPAEFLRVSVRNHSYPNSTSHGHGVRVARTAF